VGGEEEVFLVVHVVRMEGGVGSKSASVRIFKKDRERGLLG